MPGPTLSKNTADFELLLGGRYLLESVTPGTQPDGYLLEDGSGVLLLDCVTPSLGDPVTFTNPSWSGRVVSVAQDLIVDGAKRNYKRVSVTATNQTADPGGTAPGDFSDTVSGGRYLLEDGSGDLLLEGSGGYFVLGDSGVGPYDVLGDTPGPYYLINGEPFYYLLEGTSFAYRELSVRQSQNQDGTTTTYGSLVTFEGGFQAGQTFRLTNNDLGYAAQSFAITNVTTDFIGAGTPTPRYRIEFGDAYQTLQLAGGGILTRTASVATQALGVVMPGGVLGYAQVTANQGSITTAVDLTGLAVTVTVGSGRRIRVRGVGLFGDTLATGSIQLLILEGATQLQAAQADFAFAAINISLVAEVVLQPTAGVHTYKLQAVATTGTGTLAATATAPAFISVEDVGV